MPLENPLNESGFVLPLLLFVHLIGIVCGLGTAALVDLRLMGMGAGNRPSQLWSASMLVTLIGFSIAIFSGLLLFSIDPERYIENDALRWKLAALGAALGFYYTMVRGAAKRDQESVAVGLISLALLAMVPLGGILIGYE